MKFAHGSVSGKVIGVRADGKKVEAGILIADGTPAIRVTAWGKGAELLGEAKGKYVVVSGELALVDGDDASVKKRPVINANSVTECDANTSVNAFAVAGFMAREATVKYTDKGLVIASFSLAVDKGKESVTSWFDVTVFNKTAETIANYTQAKSYLGIYNAYIKWDSWTDKATDEPRHKMVLNATSASLAARGISEAPAQSGFTKTTEITGSATSAPATNLSDVPF